MLKTIQIIALLQGLFLLFILFQRKKEYKAVTFWLFFGCILSVLLYAIGDDDYHLYLEETDWFLFHDTLIITFFFLFVRYYKSNRNVFQKKDLLFVLPYAITTVFHTFKENVNIDSHWLYPVILLIVELAFTSMLFYTIYDIIKHKKDKWLLIFILPLTFIFLIDEISFIVTRSYDSPFFLDSYGIILVAIFLFYFVLYKLLMAQKDILPKLDKSGYKSSTLNSGSIEELKTALHNLMVNNKRFKNQKLTVGEVANELCVPRQQISEVLNMHMNIGFQDYLNQFRVEEFISCLENDSYKNYTLLAIANEVGFSSKTSFNTTFKKLKGVTPSAYKKSLK